MYYSSSVSSIYNLRRRTTSLSPVSSQAFHEEVESCEKDYPDKHKHTDTGGGGRLSQDSDENTIATNLSDEGDSSEPEDFNTSQCLFCNVESSTLERSLDHMSTLHGLFVPEADYLTDIETFVGYLGVIVTQYHECLYCGISKSSTEAIRQHMRDRGHCMINFDEDSELLEFWEFPESGSGEEDEEEGPAAGMQKGKAQKISEKELRLPSGAIVGSRSDAPHGRHKPISHRPFARRAELKTITDGDTGNPVERKPVRDRQLTVRGEMGMIGVPEQQRRALRAVEKKMLKQEVLARAQHRWAKEKVANKQKFFKPDVPGPKNG